MECLEYTSLKTLKAATNGSKMHLKNSYMRKCSNPNHDMERCITKFRFYHGSKDKEKATYSAQSFLLARGSSSVSFSSSKPELLKKLRKSGYLGSSVAERELHHRVSSCLLLMMPPTSKHKHKVRMCLRL